MASTSVKMNCSKLILLPARLISLSHCRSKVIDGSKKINLNLKDDVQVPVEKDTHKLAAYVCGTNLYAEEGEDVKIKPDSEYPEWLWTMRSPPPLEELDVNSKTYWNRVGRIREREIKYLRSLQRNKSVHK